MTWANKDCLSSDSELIFYFWGEPTKGAQSAAVKLVTIGTTLGLFECWVPMLHFC